MATLKTTTNRTMDSAQCHHLSSLVEEVTTTKPLKEIMITWVECLGMDKTMGGPKQSHFKMRPATTTTTGISR
jgi:hypothetical protein